MRKPCREVLAAPALARLNLGELGLAPLPLAVLALPLAQAAPSITALSGRVDTTMAIDILAIGTLIDTAAIGTATMAAIGPTWAGARSPLSGRTTAIMAITAITRGTVTIVASRTACSVSNPTIRFHAPIVAMMAVAIRARDLISERPPRGVFSFSRRSLHGCRLLTHMRHGALFYPASVASG